MPSPYELVQLVNNQFGIQPQETIEEINDLRSEIDKDPKKFTYELSQEIEEFSEKLGLCPLCGCNLVKLESSYEPSEYCGQSVYEEHSRYGCESSSCSYIKE
jgi:hypothetical protein